MIGEGNDIIRFLWDQLIAFVAGQYLTILVLLPLVVWAYDLRRRFKEKADRYAYEGIPEKRWLHLQCARWEKTVRAMLVSVALSLAIGMFISGFVDMIQGDPSPAGQDAESLYLDLIIYVESIIFVTIIAFKASALFNAHGALKDLKKVGL